MKEWNLEEHRDLLETPADAQPTPVLDGSARKTAARAMKLLLFKMRTEKELHDKLAEEEYPEEEIAAALAYCKSFGYLNDDKYAENYLISMREKKSIARIKRELREKGIDDAAVENAVEENPFDEYDTVYALVCKKAGEPHRMEEKELRRVYGFLARKGYSSGVIWRAIRAFQDAADEQF